MRFPHRRTVLLVLRLLFFGGLLGLFYAGWRYFYSEVSYWFYGYFVVMLSYAFILLAFSSLYGSFKVGQQRLGLLVLSSVLAVLFTNVAAYFELSLIAYEMLPLSGMALVTAAQWVYSLLCCWVMNKAWFAMSPPWKVAAVVAPGTGDDATLKKMAGMRQIYTIAQTVDAAAPLDEILAAVAPCEAVLVGTLESGKKTALLGECYRTGKRIHLIPTPLDVVMNSAVKTQVQDAPVLLCRNRQMTREEAFVKRLGDVCTSLLGLIVGSPVFLIIAVAVRASGSGPVIYRQRRLTRGGKAFDMYKFRSMNDGADAADAEWLVADHDPRVTPVGRVLRRFRLDELPQLWNVLRGDMSMVGPRPERPEVYEKCRKTLPDFGLRLTMKAGLTGYAQIYGRYNTSLKDKLNLDLIYIESYSLRQDILLMLMTVKVLFIKESTQGAKAPPSGDRPTKE